MRWAWTSEITLEEAAVIAGHALQLKFERRNSSYRCGDYYAAGAVGGRMVRLVRNCEEDDGQPWALDAPLAAVVLELDFEPSVEEASVLQEIADLSSLPAE